MLLSRRLFLSNAALVGTTTSRVRGVGRQLLLWARRKRATDRDGLFEVGEVVQVLVSSLTNLGFGVAKYEGNDERDGAVIFVPYVIPGEVVRCRVWRSHNTYASADLLEVVNASEHRVEPKCALFGDCGGCQYQHLSLEVQRDWKRRHVEDSLSRLAGASEFVVEDTRGGDLGYGYRSKLTPHYDAPKQGQVGPIGFNNARYRIIDVERCAITTEAINRRLESLRVEVRDKVKRTADTVANPPRRKPRGATLLLRHHSRGVATEHDELISESVAGLHFTFRANDFWQNNPDALPLLVEHVVAEASQAGRLEYLVDCYCGGGLFALAAASHFREVYGLEISETGILSAKANAIANSIQNANFQAGKAEDLFRSVAHLPPEQTAVILDPPRKGASADFLQQLIVFRPALVVYVSCDPATQARDAALLLEGGFSIARAVPFDLFPQTRHIESVLTFRCNLSDPARAPHDDV